MNVGAIGTLLLERLELLDRRSVIAFVDVIDGGGNLCIERRRGDLRIQHRDDDEISGVVDRRHVVRGAIESAFQENTPKNAESSKPPKIRGFGFCFTFLVTRFRSV